VHSLDFAPIARMQADNDWSGCGELLARSAATLEQAGAEVIGLATNTMHIVADAIEAAIDVPLIHIADPTASELEVDGFRRVGLLGTRFTMQMPFYRERLERRGFEVLVPDTGITNLDGI